MFIPLSIDRVESSKLPYFFTNAKVAVMAIIIISYFFLVIPIMDNTTSITPVLFLTGIYVVLLYYLVRFYMFEESRLKKLVRELDNNKKSSISYFNSVQGITKQGMIKYQYSLEIKYAMVVYVQRGSKVGVPLGFMEDQINVMNDFLREIHRQGYDFDRYEMTKTYEMSDALKYCANKLLEVEGETLTQFHRLQLEALQHYSMGQSSEIVDYFVIYNTRVSTLKTFKDLLEEIIDENFKASRYFSNVKILDKKGVTDFFSEVIGLDNFDINNVKRMVEHADMSEFAKVSREFDEYGEEVIDIEGDKEYKATGRDDIEVEIKKEEKKENERIKRKVDEFMSKQNRELNRFDKKIINFEQLKQREYEIFDNLFSEENLNLLGEEMNDYYRNWKTHKKELEMDDEDDVLDLDFIEDVHDSRDDFTITNDEDDEELEFAVNIDKLLNTQPEPEDEVLDLDGLEEEEEYENNNNEDRDVLDLDDLDEDEFLDEDDLDEEDIFDNDDYEVGYGFYDNRIKRQ